MDIRTVGTKILAERTGPFTSSLTLLWADNLTRHPPTSGVTAACLE